MRALVGRSKHGRQSQRLRGSEISQQSWTEYPGLFYPAMLNEKGWLRKEYFSLVTLCGKRSSTRAMKYLRKNKLIATHVENDVEWLEILEAGEGSGDAASEVGVVFEGLADEVPMP